MSKVMLASNFLDTTNIGDLVCSPLRYSIFDGPVRFIPFEKAGDGFPSDVVIGGGGMLFPTYLPQLEALSQNTSIKRVIWGIGTNFHDQTEAVHPEWLRGFNLVGLRDTGPLYGMEFVPCPSCLHREFKIQREAPTHEFVLYEHWQYPISITDAPRMTNQAPADDFWKVLDFLASGEVVISNSYHGLYWAVLLGRKALCYEPFSNRFHHVPWKMAFCDHENWAQKVKEAVIPEFDLNEAVARNLIFRQKVEEVLLK